MKTCKEDGCNNKVFSKGLCLFHWRSSVHNSAIKKVSKKASEKQVQKKVLLEQDKLFYERIWASREHCCYECGEKLSEPLLQNFHHLLPKRNYPELRHKEENIVILCWNCHNQAEIFLEKTPKVHALTEKMKELYDRRI